MRKERRFYGFFGKISQEMFREIFHDSIGAFYDILWR
jgi:hypothetical protein